jgi:exodeoxyribonuclease VII large subunit
MREEQYLSVSQLNAYASAMISGDAILQNLFVKGEISNFKAHVSGNFYFSLKDDNASIRCVMFRTNAMMSGGAFREGMQVVASGRAGLFEREGQFQLYVNALSVLGVGDLYAAFDALKRKLEAEGLFDEQRKIPLPALPRKIGIVTSPTGAVIQDIIHVTRRRFENMQLLLYPVQVQGSGAAEEIARGIQVLDSREDIDVIIIGRGGGSAEDLWAFNDETLVRCIASCETPVVSAIGHQTDFTLSDFAADWRAPTPSAAAEICVPVKRELAGTVENLKTTALRCVQDSLEQRKSRLAWLSRSLSRRGIENILSQKRLRLDRSLSIMYECIRRRISQASARLDVLNERLRALDPDLRSQNGWVRVSDKDTGALIRGVRMLREGKLLELHFHDGKAEVLTKSITKKKRGDQIDTDTQ